MANLVFLQSREVKPILQQLIGQFTFDNFFLKLLPFSSVDAAVATWEQLDNFKGQMDFRGSGGPYPTTQREGRNVFMTRPGYFGNSRELDETYLNVSTQLGSAAAAIDLTDAQSNDLKALTNMCVVRMTSTIADLLCTGTTSVTDPATGATLFSASVNSQTYTASTSWSDHANSTPIADMLAMKLLHRGYSVNFGSGAQLVVNSTTVNAMLQNTNANDLGAKRVITVNAGAQPMTLADINRYNLEAGLPTIVEYDEGYYDGNGSFTKFIADYKGVLVGKRLMGEPVGEFILTRNLALDYGHEGSVAENNTGPLGNVYYDFSFNKEKSAFISRMGYNGVPAVYYPSAIVKVNL